MRDLANQAARTRARALHSEGDMLMPPISRFMTRGPFSVDTTATLAQARALMEEHAIRHLPIIDGTELVGIVSRSGLQAVEGVHEVAFDRARVAQLMVPPVCVGPHAALDEVSLLMSEQRLDCVVVLGVDGVEGIFTATDAMRALAELLRRMTA